jgi:hypothetical protein
MYSNNILQDSNIESSEYSDYGMDWTICGSIPSRHNTFI